MGDALGGQGLTDLRLDVESAKVLRLRSVWSPSSVMSGVASSRTGAWAPAVSMIPEAKAGVPVPEVMVCSSVELWLGSTASGPVLLVAHEVP